MDGCILSNSSPTEDVNNQTCRNSRAALRRKISTFSNLFYSASFFGTNQANQPITISAFAMRGWQVDVPVVILVEGLGHAEVFKGLVGWSL